MVRAKQGRAQAAIQDSMCESEVGETNYLAAGFQDAQVRVESDFSQRDNNLNVGEHLQFAFEERTAVA